MSVEYQFFYLINLSFYLYLPVPAPLPQWNYVSCLVIPGHQAFPVFLNKKYTALTSSGTTVSTSTISASAISISTITATITVSTIAIASITISSFGDGQATFGIVSHEQYDK